jgi:O-antigen polymerase
LLFIPVFYKNRKTYFKPLVFIFLGILAGIIALKTIQQVDRDANLYKDKHRSTMYQVSAQMFIDKPILGYGYGNFRKAFMEYHSAKMKSDNQIKPPYDLNHPHNETLFWAVEGGIASVIALFVFAGAYLTLFKGQPYTKVIPLLALITPILIHSQTEFPFYHSITHWFYFIVFIWFAEQQTSTYKSIELQHTLGLKVLAIALPLFTSIFMITAIHTSLKMESLKANNYENIDGFNDIVNVIVWQHHIEVTKNTALLRQGFKNRNPKALVDYISWGFEFSKHTPKKELYQNMILAINTLEKNNVAINDNLKKTIYNDAVKLYPSFTNKN